MNTITGSPQVGAAGAGTASTVTSADGTTIGYTSLGSGDDVILVGGVLRTADDYMGLGRALAEWFTVHVMDRRGRGTSGPQGPRYSVDRECEDLLALQAQTGAHRVFGHSYGGFVVLEAARRTAALRKVAVYEPGLSLAGGEGLDWLGPYQQLLADGDARGAFATMVRSAGHAPRALTVMPQWCLRVILRVGIRGREWERTRPLLAANLAEHQVLRDTATGADYSDVTSEVLLLGGSRSPAFVAHQLETLHESIRGATITMLDGLDHVAPEAQPEPVARRLEQFFTAPVVPPPVT